MIGCTVSVERVQSKTPPALNLIKWTELLWSIVGKFVLDSTVTNQTEASTHCSALCLLFYY